MMPEWTKEQEAEHAAIVDQLRRQGWDRLDAIEEADRLCYERELRRKGTKS